MKICLVAGDNPHYVHSLVQALASTGLTIDLIGDDRHKKFEFSSRVRLLNLRGSRDPKCDVITKLQRILRYYSRCLAYMWKSDNKLVHVQGFRFNFLEGVILLSLYRMFGKTIIYTAHDLQPKSKHNAINYLVFYFIYRAASHIICHTKRMKQTLATRYKIAESKITVVRHGLNFSVPVLQIDQLKARRDLSIDPKARVLLMFGKIQPYKGIHIALQALKHLGQSTKPVVLLVVGGGSDNSEIYLKELKDYVNKEGLISNVRFHIDFVPDEYISVFFRSADLLLLPYTEGDFQSGVLFLAYRFGLPVIVSNVGSLAEDVEDGITGLVFSCGDAADLAKKIDQFYHTLHSLPELRQRLLAYVHEKYKWDELARATVDAYRSTQLTDYHWSRVRGTERIETDVDNDR